MRIIGVFVAALLGCFAGAYIAHLYIVGGHLAIRSRFLDNPHRGVVIGARGTLVGALIGAFILYLCRRSLRAFGTFRIVIYCIILTGFIVFKSEGS
jgi:branched-chain amino acid transport system permease protein